MCTNTTSFWKRLWRWTTSECLTDCEMLSIVGSREVIDQLRQGLDSYKPLRKEQFIKLQSENSDQTKLLHVLQILQNYVDVDAFQMWEVIKHYLCDISYGTPADALKNVAFVDTRPSFLLPNIWRFYCAERLFLLKLLQYIIEFKDNEEHKYQQQFRQMCDSINFCELKSSLLNQFSTIINVTPPPRKINSDFSSTNIQQEWAESNMREQFVILQILLLIANETAFTETEFRLMFELFKKHNYGKNQGFMELLEERHREYCMRIMYSEVSLFMVVVDATKINDVSSWINSLKQLVESELTKLQVSQEYSALLMTWMLLTLHSDQHARLFESQYQQLGATALKLHVFEFLQQLVTCSVYSCSSKTSMVAKLRIFHLLNELCDKFDGDGSLGHQPGAIQLCAELLKTQEIANEFWQLHANEGYNGTVSFWNTALEYFPFNFNALSILACALAQGGRCSALKLIEELINLPVYTEVYNPHSVPIAKVSVECDDVIVGRDYYPLANPAYRVAAGSRAAIMERKEGTLIHFRTAYSYWTIFNNEVEKALDRKGQHRNINVVLQRIWEGSKLLKQLLNNCECAQISKDLFVSGEGVFDVLVRFMRAESPPLPLLVSCVDVCTALVQTFSKEVYSRLINTGLFPRIMNQHLTHKEYAEGVSFDSAVVGLYLVTEEQPCGTYDFLVAYIDMLCAFHKTTNEERILSEVLLPGLVLILREVLPNICSWRYGSALERRRLIGRCVECLTMMLHQSRDLSNCDNMIQYTCVYSLLNMENAVELLKIVSVGNEQLERMIYDEVDWVSGSCILYLRTMQRALAILLLTLRLKKKVANPTEMTPLEHLIFAQNKQKDPLKVVSKVASYINNVFNVQLAVLCCRVLNRFAADFQMSLFTCLDMTAYQVRLMFLQRLRDGHEYIELKVAILDFVATCVGKQPGLTEAFFKMRHNNDKSQENKDNSDVSNKETNDDSAEGILTFMAQYLGIVKKNTSLLNSPLLGCVMALFHALWRNNMQILVKELRENPKFWEHMTSPLFSSIEPGIKAYAQIFNVLGMELFTEQDKIESTMKDMLEKFFDTNKQYLDNWIKFIFSFETRHCEVETTDQIPSWLGLLTSWKDFTTIFCKTLPINLNIAHKGKMVAPCMTALLKELDDLKDGRLVVILAELYVIMLANWKDDCFDNRKANAKQIDSLLSNTAMVYDCLHPRAKRAILSIGTVAISTLDYEIKANSSLAQSIIRSVTNINSFELGKLFDNFKKEPSEAAEDNGHIDSEEIPPIVLSLSMLEQCLDLYDDMFSGLGQWFQSTRFINKLLCCLHTCIQNRKHYHTSLTALRCLTAYSRGPFSKELLLSDIDQFLWLQLLPPKLDANGGKNTWKPAEWWKVYGYSMDFISMMVMKHGQYFANDAVTFVGVHLEYLIEAILLPRQLVNMDSLNMCASTLNLVVQLVKYETRWRIENITSLVDIMRSISTCLYQCVTLCLRSRRTSDVAPLPAPLAPHTPHTPHTPATPALDDSVSVVPQPQHTPTVLNRILEILHMATLCLLSFSPDLLSLLAEPALDLERWQPLVELHFGAPKISYEPYPQLTFGTLMSAICLLTKSLNHAYHMEEGSGSRSPRGRRRVCSCGSPGEGRRAGRSESLTSMSSGTSAAPWAAAFDQRLVAAALEAALTLLAEQALLAVRDPKVPPRHKQLVRRELSSELTVFHDFVRKRILCAAHARPHLVRNKLGAWPLPPDEEELTRTEDARKERSTPPPPPPKRVSHDSMREYILRKHYLDKCAQTPIKDAPSPVSHSTPTSDKKKDASRSSKRVSWAESTRDTEEDADTSPQEIYPVYSNLTDVQINNDEDYLHFMSVVFLYVCQNEL